MAPLSRAPRTKTWDASTGAHLPEPLPSLLREGSSPAAPPTRSKDAVSHNSLRGSAARSALKQSYICGQHVDRCGAAQPAEPPLPALARLTARGGATRQSPPPVGHGANGGNSVAAGPRWLMIGAAPGQIPGSGRQCMGSAVGSAVGSPSQRIPLSGGDNPWGRATPWGPQETSKSVHAPNQHSGNVMNEIHNAYYSVSWPKRKVPRLPRPEQFTSDKGLSRRRWPAAIAMTLRGKFSPLFPGFTRYIPAGICRESLGLLPSLSCVHEPTNRSKLFPRHRALTTSQTRRLSRSVPTAPSQRFEQAICGHMVTWGAGALTDSNLPKPV